MADAHTPPKPVDVLGILNPDHRLEGNQWRPIEGAGGAMFEAYLRVRLPESQRGTPPRLAVIDADDLEACRALVSRMAAGLARIAFMGSETGPPTPDLLALWRSEAREIAREALTWLPTERPIAEEVERGVQVMKDGMAWGLAYADGQVTELGWIKPTDAPIHDARYVQRPTDVLGHLEKWRGTYTAHFEGAKVVSVERRTVVSTMR